MSLPALPVTTDTRSLAERTNVLIRQHNRLEQDVFVPIYAADTGSATAYAIAPVPGIALYKVGQIFAFKAANANSGAAPTLEVNSKGAGTIMLPSGGALAAGDIAANGMTLVQVAAVSGGTPTLHLLNALLSPVPVTNSGATTFLGADVALNNIASFFNGPNTGIIGGSGQVWLIIAGGVIDTSSVATTGEFAIHDGSTYVAASTSVGPNANWPAVFTLAVVVTLSAPTTFTLRAKANSALAVLRTTGLSSAVGNKATFITAVRLA